VSEDAAAVDENAIVDENPSLIKTKLMKIIVGNTINAPPNLNAC
jgi:hypothetical protein